MFATLQYLLPKHLLSRIVGHLAASENVVIRWLFINIVCLLYDIDLTEAARTSKSDYRSFNDFFTRELTPGARTPAGRISSPADGTVAAVGTVTRGELFQSKKYNYSLEKLIAGSDTSDYEGGSYITIYLAPHNYHRVHMAVTGELHRATYVPGDLFSVNNATAANLPDLFARNERLVCRFRSAGGPMISVMVGAMLVAGIQPVWLDQPYKPRLQITTEMKQTIRQGDELGQFQMGSTVILLFSERLNFNVGIGDEVRVGQSLVD